MLDNRYEHLKKSYKEELKELELNINVNGGLEDFKKFEQLSNDPDVQSAVNKISEQCCKIAFEDEWKNLEKVNIWKYITNILKKYPDLWLYVSWTLGLPLTVNNFSDLTIEQKMSFLSLHKTLNIWHEKNIIEKINNIWYSKNNTSGDIIKNCDRTRKSFYDKLNREFRIKNILSLLPLKTALKNNFWLVDQEISKYMDYLKIIKKHPEYIWKVEVQQAWTWGWLIFWLITGVLLWVLWYYFVDNFGKSAPHIETYSWRIEISDPEPILRLLTQESEFKTFGIRKIEMFHIDSDNSLINKAFKKIVNVAQYKEIKMEMTGHLWIQYDLSDCKMEIDKHTGVVYLTVCKPTVVVTDSQARITGRRNELLMMPNNEAFSNLEMELQQELKETAINDALNNPHFYDKAMQGTKEQLLPLLQAMQPHWVEIKDLEIIYMDKLPPINIPKH